MKKKIITIDGPAASGKGEIAKYISKKWKFKHLDSGILYRRLAYDLFEKKININSLGKIKTFMKNNMEISYKKSKKLRNEEISKLASKIAVHGFVRDYINSMQRKFINNSLIDNSFVIDGRDIGSKVFKNANIKLFIRVNSEIRAKRRHKQLIELGEKTIYAQILKEINLRDKTDKHRLQSPIVIPRGAIIIDNSKNFLHTKTLIDQAIDKIR